MGSCDAMSMTLIQEQVLGSAVPSVTFGSIPQAYTDLYIEIETGPNTSNSDGSITFNGDTGTNYSRTYVLGNGSAASSGRDGAATGIHLLWTDASGGPFVAHYDIMSYANTSIFKNLLARESGATWAVDAGVGLWRSTAAITSIAFTTAVGNFAAGSTFRLWGIK